jgi:hypothetical protein
MDMDLVVLKIVLTSFFIFLCLHLLVLTFLKEELKVISLTRILFILGIISCIWNVRTLGIEIVFITGFMFSLFAGTYALYILRLIFDPPVYSKVIGLFDGKESKSMEQILEQCNAQTILDEQLKNLESSHRIVRNNRLYTLTPQSKSLFMIDSIKCTLCGLIDTSNP